MSNFELGYCSPVEYKHGKDDRVLESQLAVGGLYVIMFDLGNPAPKGAAKYPARVKQAMEPVEGIIPVEFTVLNADLAKRFDALGHFRDGFWQPTSPTKISVESVRATEGYFRDYGAGDSVENFLQEVIKNELALVAA